MKVEHMKNFIKSAFKGDKSSFSPVHLVLFVILGTELFHFVNSAKLNLIMPTLSNLLKETTVRSWSVGNGTLCIRYGNFLWDTFSVVIFLSLLYVLWRIVFKRYVK